jgi:hypothetical protein
MEIPTDFAKVRHGRIRRESEDETDVDCLVPHIHSSFPINFYAINYNTLLDKNLIHKEPVMTHLLH